MDYANGHVINTPTGPIHYVVSGPADAPAAVLIPGSPSTWRDLGHYVRTPTLAQHYRIAVVDRPGYGGSGAGTPEPTLAGQAARILPVLEAVGNGTPVVLLGHSYGGPVALQLAVHYPKLVRTAIVLHGVVDPNTVTFQWLRDFGRLFGKRVPALLRVSTAEMNALPKSLRALAADADKLRVPVRMIQGMRDFLAPKDHADFAQRTYPAAYLQVERHKRMGHLTPFTNRAFVTEVLLTALRG